MYTSPIALMLGFHGCDREIGELVLAGKVKHLQPSENGYDWLGNGIYFWENNPERAMHYARELKERPRRGKPPIKSPFVLGAVIDPGRCLNLLESTSLRLLTAAYDFYRETREKAGGLLTKNKVDPATGDVLLRPLDCAVIEALHASNREHDVPAYDTVRGVFLEGAELYAGSAFREKNHIQICVRNPACIHGYFRLSSAE